MKKYPKIVQCDKRGQIVIPKDIRLELKIEEGTGFWMYSITDEGILLKKVDVPELSKESKIVSNISEKSDKLKIDKKKLNDSVEKYKKTKEGKLELL